MKKISEVDLKIICEYMTYNKDSGFLVWKKSLGRKIKPGNVVGSLNYKGYIEFDIFGKRYRAHRVIWAMQTGSDTDLQIDHINGVKSDNRIENLRAVTCSVNMQNQRNAKKTSKTGILGASPRGSKFVAQIKAQGAKKYIGMFHSAEEAGQAYLLAKRRLHEGCTL